MTANPDFTLGLDSLGRLSMTDARGAVYEDIVPVRAYPVSAPDEGIALVSRDGHELAWIEHLADLPSGPRELVEQSLATREFMPEIHKLIRVSSFATPSTWEVETDRGLASLVLKGEEDIRRMPNGVLLISDAHGIQFMIRRLAALDRHSRKLLDRFL